MSVDREPTDDDVIDASLMKEPQEWKRVKRFGHS